MSRYLPEFTALAAFLWVLARAALQSVTIDEATTYELFIGPAEPFLWSAASNNHILHTAIARLFVSLFGLSHLTLRSAALIGAASYITAAVVLARWLSDRTLLRWAAVVCLVCNPFVMDYLVAARGYGLAAAFLLWMLVVMARHLRSIEAPSPVRPCATCSVLAALCVAANFSFGVVCVSALLTFAVMVGRRQPVRVLAACVAPGLMVSAFLTLHAVLNWPAGQLWWGAQSLKETARSLRDSVLHEPNPNVVNPLLMPVVQMLRPWLIPGVFLVGAVQCALLFTQRMRSWRLRLAGLIAATLLLTVAAHWLAFRLTGMLLPKERTALYAAVLCTLLILAIASVPSKLSRVTTGVLIVTALYFLGCLRLTYFLEWRWDAGARQAYHVAAWYNHNRGITRVASSWHYSAVLNFYRVLSGRETIVEVTGAEPVQPGHQLYVLHDAVYGEFIERNKLRIVWRGPENICIAVP